MRHYPLIAAILAATLIPMTASANGDPVIEYSAVMRSANPVPMTISEISLVSEKLTITPGVPYTRVDVEYTLRNDSGKDFPKINYGFPIDYRGGKDRVFFYDDGITECIYEAGWYDKNIKDIRFSLDGNALEWTSSDEVVQAPHHVDEGPDVEVAYDDPGVSRLWTYTSFGVKAHSTAVLKVSYSLRFNQSADFSLGQSLLTRFFTKSFIIDYYLRPAKHWGNGKVGKLDVTVDFSSAKGFINDRWEWPRLSGLDFTRKGDAWTFSEADFDYSTAEPLHIMSFAESTDEPVRMGPWVSYDYLLLGKSLYTVRTSSAQASYTSANISDGSLATAWVAEGTGVGAKINIDFKTPQRISDVQIYNGYHKSGHLLTSNSRIKTLQVTIDRIGAGKEVRELDLEGDLGVYTDARNYEYGTLGSATGIVINPEGGEHLDKPVKSIELKVLEVTPGTKYKDLCVSEIKIYGTAF